MNWSAVSSGGGSLAMPVAAGAAVVVVAAPLFLSQAVRVSSAAVTASASRVREVFTWGNSGVLGDAGGRRLCGRLGRRKCRVREVSVDVQQPAIAQQGEGILGVALEMRARRTEPEGVAPRVHVGPDARAADAGQRVAEQRLQ